MVRTRVAVFASGGGTNFENLVQKQEETGIEIVVVISEYNSAYAIQRAINKGIDYIVVEREKYDSRADFEKDMLSVLKMYQVEYILLAGYMRILSVIFIVEYLRWFLHINPSMLLDFRLA